MVVWQLTREPRSWSITSQSGIKMDTLVFLSTLTVKPLRLINELYAFASSQGRSLSVLHVSSITTLTS